jgi:D-ribose pyranase
MTWEYLETRDATDLPGLGAEGWELVAVVPEGAGHKYVFKRPAADLKPRFSREQVEAFFAGGGHAGPEHASPLLNPHVASLIRRLGHTDWLLIPDKGFPLPPGVETVDLSLSADIPTVPQIIAAIAADFPFDRLLCAEELKQAAPQRFEEYRRIAGNRPVETFPHVLFKEIAARAKGCLRSADSTPFGNVVLVSG